MTGILAQLLAALMIILTALTGLAEATGNKKTGRAFKKVLAILFVIGIILFSYEFLGYAGYV